MKLRVSPMWVDMLKVHVQPYSRSGPGGGTVQVGAYDDRRAGAQVELAKPQRGPGVPPVPTGAPAPAGKNAQPMVGAAQGGALQRPLAGGTGQVRPQVPPTVGKQANPWAPHGDKLYVLTGKDEYLHSDTGGASWRRSKVPDADLRADAGARDKVREHLESQGYKNPPLSADLLAHVRDARAGAKEHPGHFEDGVAESSFRHRQRQAVEREGAERAPAREAPPGGSKEGEAQAPAVPSRPDETPTDPEEHAKALAEAKVEAGRPLGVGLSAAMLLKLQGDGRGIFKRGGEHEPNVRYGSIPHGTAHKREVAARAMDDLLGTGLVPPTVSREHEGVEGSMQAWLEGAQSGHEVAQLRGWLDPGSPQHNARVADAVGRMGLFDAAIGHGDRHAGNVVLTPNGDVRAIDNGIAFGYGFEDVASHSVAWEHPVRVPPDLRQKFEETSLAEVRQAVGEHVEPWAAAHTYARMKYLASKSEVHPGDLTTQKLFEFAKEKLPHVYDQMVASWDDWGPEPPRWKEVTEGAKWPPEGKPGHEHAMRETAEQARRGVRSDRTAPSKPKVQAQARP